MAARPGIGPGDRLGATLALSAVLFGVLILGVGFALDRAAPVAPTLDVILTETRSETSPATRFSSKVKEAPRVLKCESICS